MALKVNTTQVQMELPIETAEEKAEKKEFYELLKQNKTLIVSVDPGYDAYKIIINGEFHFRTSSLTVQAGKSIGGVLGRKGDITIEDRSSAAIKTYLMGRSAHVAQRDASQSMAETMANAMNNEERFAAPAFQAGFRGALYSALYEYAESENNVGFTVDDLFNKMRTWNIHLAIAVPSAYKVQAETNIRRFLEEAPKLRITYVSNSGSNVQMNADMAFDSSRTTFISQAIACYLGQYYTTYGTLVSADRREELNDELESIVLNCGYHTMGQVQIDASVHLRAPIDSVPYQDFSMELVDKRTLEKIEKEYGRKRLARAYRPLDINDCIAQAREKESHGGSSAIRKSANSGIFAYEKDNSQKLIAVPVQEYRKEVLDETAKELCDYIQSRFQFPLVHSILLTGGTSTEFYPYIEDAFKEYDNISIVRMINGICDSPEGTVCIGPVFAVASGAYGKLAASIVADLYEIDG